jgi:hypothetical protein
VNANHSGGFHGGRPKNAVIGSPDYLERIFEMVTEETAAPSGRYSRR